MPKRQTQDALEHFAIDWLLFAPLPLLILALLSKVHSLPLLHDEVRRGALLAYGLACFVAHFRDLIPKDWEPKTPFGQLMRLIGRLLPWAVVALSLVVMGGVGEGLALLVAASQGTDSGAISDFAEGFFGPMQGLALNLGVVVTVTGLCTALLVVTKPKGW